VRNHVLARWRIDPRRYLTEDAAAARILPRFRAVAAAAWHFLNRYAGLCARKGGGGLCKGHRPLEHHLKHDTTTDNQPNQPTPQPLIKNKRRGYINFGVSPALTSRGAPERRESVVVIGAGLAGA
jgi:hypothetical protein